MIKLCYIIIIIVYIYVYTLQRSGGVSPNLFQLTCNQQTTYVTHNMISGME